MSDFDDMTMEKEQVIDIDDLVFDDRNLNKGTKEGQKLIGKSFEDFGAGRSILIDKDGRIIAGNKSTQAAIATGIRKVRVIETTGDELVAVKRTDLSLDSAEGRGLALLDNVSHQENISWDKVELANVADVIGVEEMSEWGIDISEPDLGQTDLSVREKDDDYRQCPKCGFRWIRK